MFSHDCVGSRFATPEFWAKPTPECLYSTRTKDERQNIFPQMRNCFRIRNRQRPSFALPDSCIGLGKWGASCVVELCRQPTRRSRLASFLRIVACSVGSSSIRRGSIMFAEENGGSRTTSAMQGSPTGFTLQRVPGVWMYTRRPGIIVTVEISAGPVPTTVLRRQQCPFSIRMPIGRASWTRGGSPSQGKASMIITWTPGDMTCQIPRLTGRGMGIRNDFQFRKPSADWSAANAWASRRTLTRGE